MSYSMNKKDFIVARKLLFPTALVLTLKPPRGSLQFIAHQVDWFLF